MTGSHNRREHLPMASAGKTEGLRERKKRATRQLISNTATKLFMDRGFEQVTVDDVAAAANVSKMTVFNYFSRKEDLFFDRSDEVHDLLRQALTGRGSLTPVAALRALAVDLIGQGHPLSMPKSRGAIEHWKAVVDSTSLRARALELLVDLEGALGQMLATSVEAVVDDPTARLIAAIVVGTWRVALAETLRRQRSTPPATTRKVFLDLIERGFAAAASAARGTRYG